MRKSFKTGNFCVVACTLVIRSSDMGEEPMISMARFLCSIFSLVFSNFSLTRELRQKNNNKQFCKISILECKKYRHTQEKPYGTWQNVYFSPFYHSKIEVFQNCSASVVSFFLVREKIINTKTVPLASSNSSSIMAVPSSQSSTSN